MNGYECGYLVWNPKRGLPTTYHSTKEIAIAESERLAAANPGEAFFVMAAAGVSHVEKPAVFRPFDDIPF